MHHQNKTLSTKCCHPHGHSVLSTSTVCAPALRNDATVGRQSQAASGYAISIDRSGSLHVGATAAARLPCAHDTGQSMWAADSISGKKGFFFCKGAFANGLNHAPHRTRATPVHRLRSRGEGRPPLRASSGHTPTCVLCSETARRAARSRVSTPDTRTPRPARGPCPQCSECRSWVPSPAPARLAPVHHGTWSASTHASARACARARVHTRGRSGGHAVVENHIIHCPSTFLDQTSQVVTIEVLNRNPPHLHTRADRGYKNQIHPLFR